MQNDLLKELLNIINVNSDNMFLIKISHEDLKKPEIISQYVSLIPKLKKEYKSHTLTCLHKNSLDKQKFPAINMLRQILKCNNLKLKPKIIIKGYNTITKTKIIDRYFIIEKLI